MHRQGANTGTLWYTNEPMDLNWDNLRTLLAVSRAGTVRGAAKQLLMSHATVSRHLSALQEQLGVRVFASNGRRLEPTEAGVAVIEAVERMEAEVARVGLYVAGKDQEPRGTVRIALPPSLLKVVCKAMAPLSEDYPAIRLEFTTSLEVSNLTRRETDIALRITSSPPESLIGRKVGCFQAGAYTTLALAKRYQDPDPRTMPWVDWDERYANYPPAQWLAANVPRSAIRATADTETAMLDLVRAGVGVGFIPSILANDDATLAPVHADLPTFDIDIWLLTHPDLRSAGRVRIVMDALAQTLVEQKEQFLLHSKK